MYGYQGLIEELVPAAGGNHVQSGSNGSTASATSIAVTLPSLVQSGSTVVGFVTCTATSASLPTITVTDDKGNTYAQKSTVYDSVGGQRSVSFILGNITNTPRTLTATFGSATTFVAIFADEYSGVAAQSDPTDAFTAQLVSSPGTSADGISSGNITTTQASEIVWGATLNSGTTTGASAGTGETLRITNSQLGVFGYTEDKIKSVAGAVASTFTNTTTGGTWHTFAIALKATASAASVALTARGTSKSAGAAVTSGAAALNASARSSSAGRATSSGATSISAKGASQSAGKVAASGAAALAARGGAASSGKATASGAAAIRALGRSASAGKGALAGVVALAARGASMSFGKLSPPGALALFARGLSASAGRAAIAGKAALAALGASQAAGKATASGAAGLAAKGQSRSAGRAGAAATAALKAAGRSLSQGAAAVGGKAALFARGEAKSYGRAALGALTPIVALVARGLSTSSGQALLRATAALTGRGTAQGKGTLSVLRPKLNPNYIATGARRSIVAVGQPRGVIAAGLRRETVAAGLQRSMIACGAPRSRIVVGVTNSMSQTNDLTPPIDATVEQETITFDYGRMLAVGVTVSIVSISCTVVSGSDVTPSSRLLGVPAVVTSPNSGGASQAVSQLVGTMVAGTVYLLQCVVSTSDGQKPSLWTHLACQAPV